MGEFRSSAKGSQSDRERGERRIVRTCHHESVAFDRAVPDFDHACADVHDLARVDSALEGQAVNSRTVPARISVRSRFVGRLNSPRPRAVRDPTSGNAADFLDPDRKSVV